MVVVPSIGASQSGALSGDGWLGFALAIVALGSAVVMMVLLQASRNVFSVALTQCACWESEWRMEGPGKGQAAGLEAGLEAGLGGLPAGPLLPALCFHACWPCLPPTCRCCLALAQTGWCCPLL